MIALIPARGGSKGVPRKNIRLLGGKPLIYWTINAAMQASNVDRIILSTDDYEIAEICKHTGIEIPFMRPKELAHDNSLAIDNYIYTVDRLINEFNYNIDPFAVLLPTTPFRNSLDIDDSIELFSRKNADSVISCSELPHPLSWAFDVDDEGRIDKSNNPKVNKMMNRQDETQQFMPNGGVYILKHSLLKETHSYYSENTYAHIMPLERSIDIDTELDFEFAEFMVNKHAKSQ